MPKINQPETYTELRSLYQQGVGISTLYNEISLYSKTLLPFFSRSDKYKVVVYSHFGDYLSDHFIEEVCQNLKKHCVFILNHDVPDDVKEKFSSQATFIECKYSYSYYAKTLGDLDILPQEFIEIPKTRHFLSLNNRVTWPRQGLYYFIKKYALEPTGYFSYQGSFERSKYKTYSEVAKELDQISLLAGIDFALLDSEIPMTTGLDNFDINCWGVGNREYYTRAFCSIVNETIWNDATSPFFTEKTFKPIAFCQPFMLHGSPGSLQKLQDLGFKTFSKWWDESYDYAPSPQRFEKMLTNILEISKWSIKRVNEVYRDMIPILKHNRDHLLNTLPDLYQQEIAVIKEKIYQISAQRQ